MAFHIFNTKALATELSTGRVSERGAFQYFLANSLLWTLTLYYGLYIGANIDWRFLLELVIVLLITVYGLLKVFEVNGGANGHDFILRATCLSFPVGVKVNLLSICLGWINYYIFPIVVDPVSFRDPDRVLDIIFFLWAPAFTALFFWRLWVHFVSISMTNAPNNAPQSDA
jgi:hypothetical protein